MTDGFEAVPLAELRQAGIDLRAQRLVADFEASLDRRGRLMWWLAKRLAKIRKGIA
jgi:hypothetical protein